VPVVAALAVAGCGGGTADPHAQRFSARASGAIVAEVQGTPITLGSYRHWLGIAYNELGSLPQRQPVPKPPRYARCVARMRSAVAGLKRPARAMRARCAHDYRLAQSDAVSFLVRAQWLMKEGQARGVHISLSAFRKAETRMVKQRYGGNAGVLRFLSKTGMSKADFDLTIRVNLIGAALQAQTAGVRSVTDAQVASYYHSHPATYTVPRRRMTLVVVTPTRAAALKARQALRSGKPWASVANRYSEDSSKLNGGVYAVVPGIQAPNLVRAVFSSPRGLLEGPVRAAPPGGGGDGSLYYLFKVTGGTRASKESLAEVRGQIKQTIRDQRQQQAVASFTSDYTKRWRARTHCQSGYVVRAVCGNAPG